jgi:aminopeptidase N
MARNVRIIKQFNPQSYTLSLNIDPESKNFDGRLIVLGARRSKPSHRITLNQNGLKISSARIFQIQKGSEEEVPITRIVHQNKLQEVRLHTQKQLQSSNYRIELEYSGKIATSGTSGIYTSYWHSNKNSLEEIITTQFEPHYARSLLPCIDEPEAKATFKLNLRLPKDFKKQVLFNTDQESENINSQQDEKRIITFKETPLMSTYLLALILGDLKDNSKLNAENKRISIWTTPDKLKHTEFALNFANQVLEKLEQSFGVSYPLQKLDLVAVPDFDEGGMENWGLTTFREDLLLFDEEHSTLSDKQSIALVVAHEIAHQWFGNLVTMKWWDELWLNEGFANFMEYFLVDKIFPEWKLLEAYLVSEKSSAIRIDSLPSSRPVLKKVSTPHHSVEVFDAVAYEKSGNIIRMIFHLIGEYSFMKGLNYYFDKYKFSSATSKDLISAWQKFTKLNLANFIESWISKPGVPLICLESGKNPNQIVLRQSRFISSAKFETKLQAKKSIEKHIVSSLVSNPNLKSKQKEFYTNNLRNKLSKQDRTIWQIPIDFVPESSPNLDPFILKKEVHKIQLSNSTRLPLKLNRNGNSLYITSYPVEYLARISTAIKDSKLSDLDTLNLICDFISLNRSSQFEPGAGAILDIIKSANKTSNSNFWSLTGGYVAYLNYHLKQKEKSEVLKSFVKSLIREQLSLVGFNSKDNESSEYTATRFELLSLAVLAKDSKTTEEFIRIYEENKDLKSIEAEKRILALHCIAKRGSTSDYQSLVSQYKENLEDISLRDDIAYAVCLFKDPNLAKNSLSLMTNPEYVRSQDILSWLSTLIDSSKENSKYILNWITKKDGWSWLEENLSEHDINSLVMIILSTAFSNSELTKLVEFITKLNKPELEKSLNEALDIAKSRIYWHKNELPKAVDYLCKQ